MQICLHSSTLPLNHLRLSYSGPDLSPTVPVKSLTQPPALGPPASNRPGGITGYRGAREVHTAHCTLHTEHYTVYSPSYTLHTTQCTLHRYTTQCTLYSPNFTLETRHVYYPLHSKHCCAVCTVQWTLAPRDLQKTIICFTSRPCSRLVNTTV